MSKKLSLLLLLVAAVIGFFILLQLVRPQSTPAPDSVTDTNSDNPDAYETLLAFAHCMQDNGVPDFPDPQPNGINLNGTGIDRNTPEFKAAQAACESLLPRSIPQVEGRNVFPGDSAWEKVVLGGDCQCADGSEFAFWVREADPTKVVLYLEGGGSCFDAETCAFSGNGENDFYDWSLITENPTIGAGILDASHADNPFADYTFIYMALCTGDSYLGNATREYSPDLTVQHKGFVNGTAVLSYLAEQYAAAAQVVVVGKTAGSVAAPVYGGLVADLLPEAQVTVLGAQSGAFPDNPDFNSRIAELWGAYDTMPDWEVNEGLTAQDWGVTQFWIQTGLHNPDIVLARFDYAFDPNAIRAVESLTGTDASNLVALIDANEADIESAGVVLHSYTAPGQEHGILDFERFYEIEVNGVRLVDWVNALIVGEPLDDVHCEECLAE